MPEQVPPSRQQVPAPAALHPGPARRAQALAQGRVLKQGQQTVRQLRQVAARDDIAGLALQHRVRRATGVAADHR